MMVAARPNQPHELFDVATTLVGVDSGRGRSKTATLRRGISTAYYAVFHDLSHKGTSQLMGTQEWSESESEVVRWVTHTGLRTLCEAAQPSRQGGALRAALSSLDSQVEDIASNVLELQEARTGADHDDLYIVSRSQDVQFIPLAGQTLRLSSALLAEQDLSYAKFLRLLMVGAKPVRR